jgi:hypothetical protein
MLSRNVRLRFVNKYIEVPKRAKPLHPSILCVSGDCLHLDLARLALEDSTLEQNEAMKSLRHIERSCQDGQYDQDDTVVLNEREDVSSSAT